MTCPESCNVWPTATLPCPGEMITELTGFGLTPIVEVPAAASLVAVIVAATLFYQFAMDPLVSAALPRSEALRVVLAIVMLLPLGLSLGGFGIDAMLFLIAHHEQRLAHLLAVAEHSLQVVAVALLLAQQGGDDGLGRLDGNSGHSVQVLNPGCTHWH